MGHVGSRNSFEVYEKHIVKHYGDLIDPELINRETWNYMLPYPEDAFESEKTFYQKFAQLGLNLTPKLLKVEPMCLTFERYNQGDLYTLHRKHQLITTQELKEILLKEIQPMTHQLDQMHVVHGDFALRNIVCDLDTTTKTRRFAFIDFELSFIDEDNDFLEVNMEDLSQIIEDLPT